MAVANERNPLRQLEPPYRPWIDEYSQNTNRRLTQAERGIKTPWPEMDLANAELRSVEARRSVYRALDPLPGVPVIIEGWALCTRSTKDGRSQVVSLALPGDLVSACAAFSDRLSVSIAAVTNVRVAFYGQKSFSRSIADSPELFASFQTALVAEQGNYAELLSDLGRRRGEERIARLLLHILERMEVRGAVENFTFLMPLSLQDIADITRLTIPYLNQILTNFEIAGFIYRGNKNIKILDLPTLTRIAD